MKISLMGMCGFFMTAQVWANECPDLEGQYKCNEDTVSIRQSINASGVTEYAVAQSGDELVFVTDGQKRKANSPDGINMYLTAQCQAQVVNATIEGDFYGQPFKQRLEVSRVDQDINVVSHDESGSQSVRCNRL